MEVTLAFLADSANRDEKGKLNVLGIFDYIGARSFPVIHEKLTVVMKFVCSAAEFGQTKKLAIVLVTEDGERVGEIEGKLQIKEPKTPLLEIIEILELKEIFFPREGHYAFCITINGDEKARLPITLIKEPTND